MTRRAAWLPSAFSVLDLETTSLGRRARVIEIAWVSVDDGSLGAQWQSFVTHRTIVRDARPPCAATTEVADGGVPRFEDLAPIITERLESQVVFAFNARFDERVLRNEYRRVGQNFPANSLRCALAMSRRLLPRLQSYSLQSVATHLLGVETQEHRALPDALLAARVLLALGERSKERTA